MAAILRVWRAEDGDVGHVSLEVDDIYMSYWPAKGAGKNDVKLGKTHAPSYPRRYETDRRIEQRGCDVERQLLGLRHEAMIEAWDELQTQEARYNLVAHNCATVIASLLEIGSGVRPSFVPRIAIDDHASSFAQRLFLRVRFCSSWIQMWTPEAVLRYAEELQRVGPR